MNGTEGGSGMRCSRRRIALLGLVVLVVLGAALTATLVGCQRPPAVVETPTDAMPPSAEQPPATAQNDANTGADVTDDVASPQPIEPGEWKGALDFEAGDFQDVYGLRLSPGDRVEVVVTPTQQLDVQLSGEAGGWPIEPRETGFKGEPERMTLVSDATGDIRRFTIVLSTGAGKGDYTLQVTITPQDDGNAGQDAPYDWESPLPLSAGTYEGGYLGGWDSHDIYGIRLNAGQRATIRVVPAKELDVAVANSWEQYVTGAVNLHFKGEAEEVVIEAEENRIHPFAVMLQGDTAGEYVLQVTVR